MKQHFMVFGAVLVLARSLGLHAAQEHPAGWHIQSRNGKARIDYSEHHSGKASLWLGCADGNSRLEIQQTIKADLYRGKRIRLSAFAKLQNPKVEAYLNAKTSPTDMTQYSQIQAAKDTGDWLRPELTLIVPAEEAGLTIGIGIYSAGELWVDDFQIEILEGVKPDDLRKETAGREPSESARKAAVAAVLSKSTMIENADFEGSTIPARLAPLELSWQALFPNGAPKSRGTAPKDTPAVAFYPASETNSTGASVIVCPGGGYYFLSMDHEGVQVCQWLNRHGISAFLMRYRLRSDGYAPEVSLLDGHRAVRFVRSQSEKFKIDSWRIGMLGFSAGGHLAWSVAATTNDGDPGSPDLVERVSSRPDFIVLAYPAVVTWERQGVDVGSKVIPRNFPPTFIFHTDGDGSVLPEDILPLYQKLHWAGVPVEMHIFGGYGPHGMGLAVGHPTVGHWVELAESWMRKSGLLTPKSRVSVSGTVKIDGQPMYSGYVTFIPADRNDPEAVAFLERKHNGGFLIPVSHGPAFGRYTVIVREVAKEKDDAVQEPLMAGSQTYLAASPNQPPFEFVLKPGENEINLEITTSAGK